MGGSRSRDRSSRTPRWLQFAVGGRSIDDGYCSHFVLCRRSFYFFTGRVTQRNLYWGGHKSGANLSEPPSLTEELAAWSLLVDSLLLQKNTHRGGRFWRNVTHYNSMSRYFHLPNKSFVSWECLAHTYQCGALRGTHQTNRATHRGLTGELNIIY